MPYRVTNFKAGPAGSGSALADELTQLAKLLGAGAAAAPSQPDLSIALVFQGVGLTRVFRSSAAPSARAGKKVIPGSASTISTRVSNPVAENRLAADFKRYGVDEIICISVNDTFVMNEWKAAQKAGAIRFIPDGNGEFTGGMGMLVDKTELGFGKRSWRYSILVKDGIIARMFIEPDVESDPFEISDADTMLEYIAPQAPKPDDIKVFSRSGCSQCVRAKANLVASAMAFEELLLNRDYTDTTLRAVSGRTTYPQIFINGVHIGGADDLDSWLGARKAA